MRTMQQRGRLPQKVEPPIIAGRVPPHDLDAEAAVLSAVLLDRDALDRVLEMLRPDHFYSDANGRIYDACEQLAMASTPIDLMTVAGYLRDRERLAQIGGAAYLAQLADATPSVANVGAHAKIVYEKWRVRQLIASCQRIAAEGYGDVGTVQEFIDSAEQTVYDLARTPESTAAQPLAHVLKAAFEQISKATERGDRITGISTGYERLDAKTAGLHDGDLTIVAARPGMGKTSFVLNLAVNVASPRTVSTPGPDDGGYGDADKQEPGYGVAVFSLEMPREQIATRMVCSEGRVDVGKLRQGFLQPEDWRRLTEAASYLSSLPIWIDDTPALGILELRAKVRRIQSEYSRIGKLGLVVVDYLQLMKGRDGVASREQEISEISRGMKQLAKELRVPVIALSQLNRAVETRTTKDKRPQLSDLRECVVGDTLVMLADGRRVPIRTLVGTEPEVLAMSSDRQIVRAISDRVWSVGRKPIVSLKLQSGRALCATPKHRIFGPVGWTTVGTLRVGDRVAVANGLSERRFQGFDLSAGAALRVDTDQAASDVCWEEIVEMTSAGEEEVFDLTVPGPASWLADGIVSHNSGAIEQDADTIIFIYRDEYYNPETSDARGIAELIISKQRNGPTGKVLTRFTASCTRFDNLAPGDYPDMADDE